MEFKENLHPKKPGVYLMKDCAGQVLYVGKAKNLHRRIAQYFVPGRDSRPQIPLLIAKVDQIETIVVSSDKEALLLEHTLIKKHKPRYNFLLRDDKSYACLEITKHEWPALKLVRSKDVKKNANIFGPYPSGYSARQILNLLHRLFPLRECSDYVLNNRTRPCILYQINRCIAPCVQKCTHEEYDVFVNQVRKFLKGQDSSILKDLRAKVKEASENMEYEKAAHYLATIRHIEALLEKQNVVKEATLNADVLGLYREGEIAMLSLLTYQKGHLIDSRNFPMENEIEEDPELFGSFIAQNYLGEESLPHEILVPSLPALSSILSALLSETSSHQVKISVPQRGTKKKLLDMAYENAKSTFSKEKKKAQGTEDLLLDLKEELSLTLYPELIECFDNSHLSGSNPVSVMVSYVNGSYEKSRLRKYHLNPNQIFDDLKGMEEVLLRRYQNTDLQLPDLISVDGGKTQLNIVLKVLNQLNIVNVDVIALTKEAGRHDFGTTQERIFLPNQNEPILLPKHSNLLYFLQNIRDQAHKSVLFFQRKTRSKTTFKSALDDIPGIGPKKKKALLAHFKSPKQVQEASEEDLKHLSCLSPKDIKNIKEFFLK
jgi:excinuclease ABC subunit C